MQRQPETTADDALIRLSAVQRLLEIEISRLLADVGTQRVIMIGGAQRLEALQELLTAAAVCRSQFHASIQEEDTLADTLKAGA